MHEALSYLRPCGILRGHAGPVFIICTYTYIHTYIYIYIYIYCIIYTTFSAAISIDGYFCRLRLFTTALLLLYYCFTTRIYVCIGPVFSASISIDGRFVASASEDCTLRVWTSVTNSVVLSLRGHTQARTRYILNYVYIGVCTMSRLRIIYIHIYIDRTTENYIYIHIYR
jgi:WD40 repeat protein